MKLQRHSGVFSIVRLFEPNPQSPSVSSALTKYTNENENKGVKNNTKERAVRLCFSLESHLLQNLSFFLITMNGQKKATDNFLSSVKVSGSGSQQLSNATVEVDNNVFRSHRLLYLLFFNYFLKPLRHSVARSLMQYLQTCSFNYFGKQECCIQGQQRLSRSSKCKNSCM